MKARRVLIVSVILIIGALIAMQALAQEKKQTGQKQSSQDEMMAMYMKYATPGEQHKALEPLVGSWDCVTRMWMDPKAPPTESKGTSETKWILGGRFVQEDVSGDMNGMPFHGMGISGYDLYKQKYNWIWMYEMSTMIMYSEGTADSSKKVITYAGTYNDYASGQTKTYIAVLNIIDSNKHTFEMGDQGPDGKLSKNFEITYTRKK